MIRRKQLFNHEPEQGVIGDCARTAIACLLDIEPAEVPHWAMAKDWSQRRARFLASHGLAIVSVAFDCPLRDLFALMRRMNPGMLFILIGESATGVNHNVIASDQGIVWDTSRIEAGIVGPASDGFFWVEWLVPALMKATQEI